MDNQKIINAIEDIVERRFLHVSKKVKSFLPEIFHKNDVIWSVFNYNATYILCFFSETNNERVEDFQKRGLGAFPTLITENAEEAGFKILSNVKNTFIHKSITYNRFSFYLEQDTTLIICEYKISVDTTDVGLLEYTIDLAFIVTLGDEITEDNFCDYLEDLIVYYINKKRIPNE